MTALSSVEPLTKRHDLSTFDSGQPSLDTWLRRFSFGNQSSETTRTYVVHRASRVVGYFSLCAGSVSRDSVPDRVSRGLAAHPIPVILLARLAIDLSEQGKGLGAALLRDALTRCVLAADVVGVRAVLVHAINDDARRFYEHFDFEPSPLDSKQLVLLMKDLRNQLRPARRP